MCVRMWEEGSPSQAVSSPICQGAEGGQLLNIFMSTLRRDSLPILFLLFLRCKYVGSQV